MSLINKTHPNAKLFKSYSFGSTFVKQIWHTPQQFQSLHGRPAVLTLFDSRRHLLNGPEALKIELARPVKIEEPVLLLEDVGELRVAVTEHSGSFEQRSAKPFKALVEFFDG